MSPQHRSSDLIAELFLILRAAFFESDMRSRTYQLRFNYGVLPASQLDIATVQEATFSLKRLRVMRCGDQSKKSKGPSPGKALGFREDNGGSGRAAGVSTSQGDSSQGSATPGRPGHGRQGGEAYV